MKHLTVIISALIFGTLLLTEQIAPLRKRRNPFLRRFLLNMSLTVVVFLVGSVAVRNAALLTSKWSVNNSFGIVPLLSLDKWSRLMLGIVLMDLTFYYWHLANHRIRLLWRFHNVHHLDPDLDVSTSFRFHFVEILYSTVFRVLQVFVLGIAPLTYVVYETIFACCTMFHHSNVRLPLQLERLLNKAIVTPRMHGIHHSAVRGETNSNYSVVFRCWDWLHRTLVLNIRQSSINIGVPGYQEAVDNRLLRLLKMPFVKQKDYWKSTEGSFPKSNQDDNMKVTTMLE